MFGMQAVGSLSKGTEKFQSRQNASCVLRFHALIYQSREISMPFFNLNEMPGAVISPGHSTAHGPTITGSELEIGYYTEPNGTGAKPHNHKSEQIMVVVEGCMRIRNGDEVRNLGPGEAALINSGEEHEQTAIEEGTRFFSFKTAAGAQPESE